MSYNAKNYTEQGGAVTHIGGSLVFDTGSQITNLPAATATNRGGVKKGAAVADAAGSNPTAAEFKALLDSLRAAGIIASST